jgi:outer membrane protein OmpA-like peptidoglycan-associated protein
MNKFIYAFLFLLLSTTASIAQQHRYALKIGLHAGLSNYYGDLSHQIWDLPHQFKQPIQDFNFLSYGISVEYHVSRTFGLRLWGMKSQFKASDRAYEKNSNYKRALNVQTDLYDASLLGIVYFDNDLVLRSRTAIAPYFMFGAGLTHFETKGDLLSADNNSYHYWSDNSIRTASETGVNAANAQIIEQDYEYETALSPLNTEGANYSPITWNVALGLGVKFRLSSCFHLHLEALVRYTGSDYLDDVSGAYRSNYTDNFQAYAANPSNVTRSTRGESPEMNDWYTFMGLSAHYSFGQKTYKIRPSIIYTESLLLSSSNHTGTSTPTNSSDNNNQNTSPPVPTNTTGSDTTVQKITTTTTTTTIKTVTVDTANNRSSLVDPKTTSTEQMKQEPIPIKEMAEPAINSDVNKYALNNSILDSLSLQEVPQEEDPLLKDLVNTFPNTPKVLYKTDSIPLAVDSIAENVISKPVANTVLENTAPQISTTNSGNSEKVRALELQQQEQKYQYELLLQKERYERQLAELKLQKDLEQERKKSPPNTKELELQYQLKLEQQKQANELEKQKLLNQLELEKNRPAPDTKQEELKLQQQKYEADLKLQQQEYEYKLKIQELQNQLNLEQLKKVNEGTGAINIPAPSSIQTIEKLRNLNTPNDPVVYNSDTTTVYSDQKEAFPTTLDSEQQVSEALNNALSADEVAYSKALEAQQKIELAKKEKALAEREKAIAEREKALAATKPTTRDTTIVVQGDSIFIASDYNPASEALLKEQQNSTNILETELAVANLKSIEQERKIDSLQKAIIKVEAEKKTVPNQLDAFFAEKKGTYITKIYFDVAKSSLTVQAKENLATLVYYLEKYPSVQFWVKGFASKTGRTEINERLSAERAAEVANFLKQAGIQGERIRTTPLGDQESNSSNELDRRAEVHLSF